MNEDKYSSSKPAWSFLRIQKRSHACISFLPFFNVQMQIIVAEYYFFFNMYLLLTAAASPPSSGPVYAQVDKNKSKHQSCEFKTL